MRRLRSKDRSSSTTACWDSTVKSYPFESPLTKRIISCSECLISQFSLKIRSSCLGISYGRLTIPMVSMFLLPKIFKVPTKRILGLETILACLNPYWGEEAGGQSFRAVRKFSHASLCGLSWKSIHFLNNSLFANCNTKNLTKVRKASSRKS